MRPKRERAIVRYLLGELEGKARRRLEERLFRVDDSFEQLLVEEDDLIDRYVRGVLEPTEAQRFETFFLSTPERRERLTLARALYRYVEERGVRPSTAAVGPSGIIR